METKTVNTELDAAIAFHEWMRISIRRHEIIDKRNGSYYFKDSFWITDELAKYWIERIYKH